ncbi:MAG: hypothetical protein ACK5WZ_07205 [Pseudobdellovibrionaceae bacterium]
MKCLVIQLLVVCCSTIGFAQTTNSSLDSLTRSEDDPNLLKKVAGKNTEGQAAEVGIYCSECIRNMTKRRNANSNLLNFTNPGEASNMMEELNKGRQ